MRISIVVIVLDVITLVVSILFTVIGLVAIRHGLESGWTALAGGMVGFFMFTMSSLLSLLVTTSWCDDEG